MRRYVLLVLGMGALLAVLATAVATAAEGELSTSVRFGPKRLSIDQHWTGPAHPPAERELQIELDKGLQIRTKGLPACHPSPSIQAGISIEEACAGAAVGSGEETVQVAFPESVPIEVPAKVRIFNGGEREGAITLYVHGEFSAPISGAVTTKIVITRIHNGRLGWRADAQFSQLTGGAGSIFDLDLNIGRNYTYEGRKTSLLSARCTDGNLTTHLQVGFEDGTSEESTLTQPCPPQG
jgi:hypothetical protein